MCFRSIFNDVNILPVYMFIGKVVTKQQTQDDLILQEHHVNTKQKTRRLNTNILFNGGYC